jgi:hypothetical protein
MFLFITLCFILAINCADMVLRESLFLRVWFYDPSNDPHGIVNKVVARLDGPFCHCEVQFPDTVAFSVYMGTQVVQKARAFDPARYTCVCVPCSRSDMQLARRCAENSTSQSFSMMQMLLALAPGTWSAPSQTGGTFCSKLVAEVLVAAHALPVDTKVQCLTPSGLHRILHERYVKSRVAAI